MNAGKADAGDKWRLLNCRRLPGRLSVEETAVLLGVKEHDIALLIAAGCLRPLGQPAANAPKKFAAVTIETLREDAQWLNKATAALSKAWSAKNGRAKTRQSAIKGSNGRFASATHG
jgi:hypothetical protein